MRFKFDLQLAIIVFSKCVVKNPKNPGTVATLFLISISLFLQIRKQEDQREKIEKLIGILSLD